MGTWQDEIGFLTAKYGSGSGEFDHARIDRSTNSLQVIDYPHHEIHAGSSFHVSDVQNVDTTTQKWMITTPNTTKWAHIVFGVSCTGEILLTITEGADRTGTTLLSAINHNRNSDNAAGLTVHRGVSGGTTDGAVTILTKRSGATGVGGKILSGAGERDNNEYILKQNTKYIILVQTFADVHDSLELDWYEHTDKH